MKSHSVRFVKGHKAMVLHLRQLMSDLSVASIAPTRQHNVHQILGHFSFENSKIIVELGPGDGVFTDVLLSRISKSSRLIVIERNLDFVKALRLRFADLRIEIIHGCASNLKEILSERKISAVDCILSGIPLTLLDSRRKKKFFEDCSSCLHAEGQFGIYQALIPGSRAIVKKALARRFAVVEQDILSINLPPLFVCIAKGRKRGLQSINSKALFDANSLSL